LYLYNTFLFIYLFFTGAVIALQLLPSGHFVSGAADGRVRYWSGGGHPEVLEEMAFVIHRPSVFDFPLFFLFFGGFEVLEEIRRWRS
jgi:hypothetical protein